jgi:hypothetical protein
MKKNWTSPATKVLNFFPDYAGKKWPLRGSKHTDKLMSQIIRCQVSGVRTAAH